MLVKIYKLLINETHGLLEDKKDLEGDYEEESDEDDEDEDEIDNKVVYFCKNIFLLKENLRRILILIKVKSQMRIFIII